MRKTHNKSFRQTRRIFPQELTTQNSQHASQLVFIREELKEADSAQMIFRKFNRSFNSPKDLSSDDFIRQGFVF